MAFAMVIALFGCNSEKKEMNYAESADTTSVEQAGPATVDKVIKTADLRFRVKDAWKTKREISEQIKQYGGTLVEALVESKIEKTEKIRYAADSLAEVTIYSTEGRVVARIPPTNLDQFTNDITVHADFIDQQSLLLDDKTIDYQINRAKQQNRAEAINSVAKQEIEDHDNIKKSAALKDEYVNKMADNLWINNKAKLSTITISFYQARTVKKTIVANDDLSSYRPGFFSRLNQGLNNGWLVLREFIFILANLWTVLAAGLMIYIGIRYYKKNKKVNTV